MIWPIVLSSNPSSDWLPAGYQYQHNRPKHNLYITETDTKMTWFLNLQGQQLEGYILHLNGDWLLNAERNTMHI